MGRKTTSAQPQLSQAEFVKLLRTRPVGLAAVWALLLTLVGGWQGTGLFSAGLWAVGFGLAGVITATAAIYFYGRRVEQAVAALALSLTVALLAGATLGPTLPALRLSFAVSSAPSILTIDQLQSQRSELPLYASVRGRLEDELTVTDSYTIFTDPAGSSNSNVNTQTVYHTPLVEAGWISGDPVQLVITAPPPKWRFFEEEGGQVVVTGIIYPVVPGNNELAWPYTVGDIGSVTWYRDNAEFDFDADRFYILDDSSPWLLRFPFLLVVFTLIVVAALVAFGVKKYLPVNTHERKQQKQSK